MEVISQNSCYGGVQGVYRHASSACGCDMTFAVYTPPQATAGPVPCLWYLSGLTCTHENAMTKACLQEHAARRGIALVFPDTSPRGAGVADDEAFDLGQGAGFYVDATEAPWAPNFRMHEYIASELRALVQREFAVAPDRHGVTGHSMGGHGAITLALRNPGLFSSISAFAPIAHPTASDWGRKQFSAYLGADEARWRSHDSALLIRDVGWTGGVLIDQGAADPFIDLLMPEALCSALAENRLPFCFRMHSGYDHSYFFVTSFARDHVNWHSDRLES